MSESRACSVLIDGEEITYTLERKQVKHVNLRVKRDGTVYVSAGPLVSSEKIGAFVCANRDFILRAREQFSRRASVFSTPKRYVSGETFYLAGRSLRLKVEVGSKNTVSCDGVFILLQVKDGATSDVRRRLVQNYLRKEYQELFYHIMQDIYPVFAKYGVAFPALRLRNMKTRWGTCLPQKGIITLNTVLAQAPRHCIEYVIFHEFCHFIYPNHSKQFYGLLTGLVPDWRARKKVLEESTFFTGE